MSRKNIMETIRELLNNDNKNIICSIQEGNMGGVYYRNLRIINGEISETITNTSLSDNKNYETFQICPFVWKHIKK